MFANDIHSLLKSDAICIKCCWWNGWHSFIKLCVYERGNNWWLRWIVYFYSLYVCVCEWVIVYIVWLCIDTADCWNNKAKLKTLFGFKSTKRILINFNSFGYIWCWNKTDNLPNHIWFKGSNVNIFSFYQQQQQKSNSLSRQSDCIEFYTYLEMALLVLLIDSSPVLYIYTRYGILFKSISCMHSKRQYTRTLYSAHSYT